MYMYRYLYIYATQKCLSFQLKVQLCLQCGSCLILQSEDCGKVFNKSVKILGFQMKMVARLIEEYAASLDELCVNTVYDLCLLILA